MDKDSISGGKNYKYLTKLFRLLNYLGCKALGLQEYHHVLNETRKFVFPQDFPYSNGYEVYREVVVRTLQVDDLLIIPIIERGKVNKIFQ